MQTFKTSDTMLRQAAQMIKDGNAKLTEGKKQSDAGKAMIEQWLKDNRQCDVASLAIGELVNIETVCLIEIGKQNRLDQKAMQLELPEVFAKYQKQFPTIKFKPLV